MNNTLINSNVVWLNYTSKDPQYSWMTLDLDGGVAGVPGGGWLMSNTSLLVTPSCTWNSSWNGYFCPPSEASYLQVEIDDMTGRPNNTALDNITYTYPAGTRVWYAKYYQLGDDSKWSSCLGHPLSCQYGSYGCYTYTTNLVSRKGYTIRFGINDHPKGCVVSKFDD